MSSSVKKTTIVVVKAKEKRKSGTRFLLCRLFNIPDDKRKAVAERVTSLLAKSNEHHLENGPEGRKCICDKSIEWKLMSDGTDMLYTSNPGCADWALEQWTKAMEKQVSDEILDSGWGIRLMALKGMQTNRSVPFTATIMANEV
jgi:hypothetical protein